MKRIFNLGWVLYFSFTLLLTTNVFAQENAGKKPLAVEDFLRWRSIRSATISDNGEWAAYVYSIREKDDTLYVRNVNSEKRFQIPFGASPQFSDDSKWVAYIINKPYKEIKKLRKSKKPVPKSFGLLNLISGEKYSVENITSFVFAKGSHFIAIKKAKADPKSKAKGTDILLRDLNSGLDLTIGHVTEFGFNKQGTLFAYLVETPDTTGNGIHLIDLQTNVHRVLDSGKQLYSKLTWDEEGSALAVLKGVKPRGKKHRENMLLAFTNLHKPEPVKIVFNPKKREDFPEGMVISEYGDLTWSTDLTKVFFGIKEQEDAPRTKKNDEPVANVDVWHWKDERIQSVQMKQADRDRKFTYRSVWMLRTNRFFRLADDSLRTVYITRDGKWAVGVNRKPYISDWKPRYGDYYRIDVSTGKRSLMLKKLLRSLGLSPDNRHFFYWKSGHVWIYDLPTGKTWNLTSGLPVRFVNQEYDRFGEKPSYGIAGFTKDQKSIILNGQYDLWLIPFRGGKAQNLTKGVGHKEEIRFRYLRLDPEEKFIELKKPMLLSAFGRWTKKSGYYVLRKNKLQRLVFDDRYFGRPKKAKNADVLLFTRESFTEFPDYYVSSIQAFSPKRITDANPWQKEYKWGRQILFEFTNSKGVRLQGTLAIPDDYREGQKLPMIVDFYEKNSDRLHRYPTPRVDDRPNFAGLVSQGYLCMRPDIHFNLRTTHSDMLECVEAGVKKVIEMGYVDPGRIALHGHSFSGQGAAFISTHSNMFAAIFYGAGATDLISDFNQLWKSQGTNQHRYDHYGQGRFATNPYDDLELYIHESAVFSARNMNTPLLIMHGTDDGSVEWLQAIEFYNALRFNGKPVILLSYPGEGHHLRKLENQLDFQHRMMEFLDHHLKGKPAPEWMIKGVPFLKKKVSK